MQPSHARGGPGLAPGTVLRALIPIPRLRVWLGTWTCAAQSCRCKPSDDAPRKPLCRSSCACAPRGCPLPQKPLQHTAPPLSEPEPCRAWPAGLGLPSCLTWLCAAAAAAPGAAVRACTAPAALSDVWPCCRALCASVHVPTRTLVSLPHVCLPSCACTLVCALQITAVDRCCTCYLWCSAKTIQPKDWPRLRVRNAMQLRPRQRAFVRRGGRHRRRGAGARVAVCLLRALPRRHEHRARHPRHLPLRRRRRRQRRRDALLRLLRQPRLRRRLRQRVWVGQQQRLRLLQGRRRRRGAPACAASACVRAVCRPNPKRSYEHQTVHVLARRGITASYIAEGLAIESTCCSAVLT